MVAGLSGRMVEITYLMNFKTELYPSTFLYDYRYSTLLMLRIFLLVPTGVRHNVIFTKRTPLPSFGLKSECACSGTTHRCFARALGMQWELHLRYRHVKIDI